MMNIRRQKHRVPALNTTSTADISFMLLIFFLVASSMDVDKGLSRQLPPADNQQKDPKSDYNTYFNVQNELVRAYKAWRDATARKVYHRPFGKLTNDEKEKIKDMCPQRIAETYNLQEGGAQ